MFKIGNEPQPMADDARRQLLKFLLREEDADWGVVRSEAAMEAQLDYLMGVAAEPFYATSEDFTLL